MTIHVGILDKDPIRLLTPPLDERTECTNMVLIGDKSQYPIFERIQRVLKRYDIDSEFFEIPDVVNTTALHGALQSLITYLESKNTTVKLNASCGIRHRLLSVYENFRHNRWPIYVVEPNSDRMCWLYPQNKDDIQVQDKITVEDYLTIFGARAEFTEQASQISDSLFNIGKKWASNALELGPGLATLNYLATTCRKGQTLSVELSDKQQTYKELATLIQDLVDVGLATYQNGTLTFATDDCRRFSNGEWLETYVHKSIELIKHSMPTIQDQALNVQVYRQAANKEVRNELDVATVVNNKLHIIECKTKGMRDDGDDTLYKLESLRDLLGGIQARAMLVSFRPLRYNDISRAKDLGLALIGPEELAELDRHLLQWFSKAGGHSFLN
ncbi:Card1-like endonuclease domain-containing protein [Vibrio ulleungensis]|uniref:DUF1887 family protein n=1 Tax=Vibrio ulleungensis TaxID=2807619 RepID=A0ABS2HGX1_9VIBR|nr:DUF1887 family CARF protein [Vibrio ulleungensis]MBM7036793.1 DUF1887 family protein [Vibrio ulleungensis]